MERKPQTPRKPLRQRVAERRAGIKPEDDASTLKWRKRLGFAANILQGVALVMLLIYLFQFLTGDIKSLNYMIIGFYAVLFIIGRVIRIAIDIQKMTKRR